MDATDGKILHLLQTDASLTVKQIAEQIPLSVTPCWKRIQRLEAQGFIRGRVALLDPVKVNADVTVSGPIITAGNGLNALTRWSTTFRRWWRPTA